jgi:signal transduction histidine kinase
MNHVFLSRANRWAYFLVLFEVASILAAQAAQDGVSSGSSPLVTNVAQLRSLVREERRQLCDLRLEAQVRAAIPSSGMLFLEDDSGAELIEGDWGGKTFRSGERVLLEGANCSVTRGEFDLKIGNGAVVENDGDHPPLEKNGSVYLKPGRRAVRLLWFNGWGGYGLEVKSEGGGHGRRPIPDSQLFHAQGKPAADGAELLPGLSYRCYQGTWRRLPDFSSLTPVKSGVADNFDIRVATRTQDVALEFIGFLEITQAGVYRFFVNSDDGAELFLEEEPPRLTVLGSASLPAPDKIVVGQSMSAIEEQAQWSEVEGELSFVSRTAAGAELEVISGGNHLKLRVLDAAKEPPSCIVHKRIRASGICQATYTEGGQRVAGELIVPGWESIQMLDASSRPVKTDEPLSKLPLLTNIKSVQQLKRDEARRGYPALIRGVITWISADSHSFMIQDETRGIYARHPSSWIPDLPRRGEYWEVDGVSDPADFSPIVMFKRGKRLGVGRLPAPVHPTWDQLMSGSLDAQYVELEGIVTAVQNRGVTLLMREGKINVQWYENAQYVPAALKDALVSVRGCLFPARNYATHQVRVTQFIELGSAAVSVNELPPADPFAGEKKTAAELLFFDTQAGAFQRVSISGQIVHGRAGIYYMMDGTNGVRFQPRDSVNVRFQPGDLVEVAGLVELGGISPLLREAVARKTGWSALPNPRTLGASDLLNENYDSTVVRLEGMLVESRKTRTEQVLEMQAGLRSLVARLPIRGRPLEELEPGSRLELTGIYAGQGGSRIEGREVSSFEVLLNSASDLRVLARPPWWTLQRLLIITGALAGVLILALGWISLLRRQVEKRTVQLRREIREREHAVNQRVLEQERSRIARDLHDDLGSILTEISMLATQGPGTAIPSHDARQRLELIAGKSRCTVTALDELVWAVNPQNDTLSSLAKYLASYTEEYLSTLDVLCRMQIPTALPELTIPAEARHNLLLTVKEVLNNAVRHGRATEVLFALALQEARLEILIQDNGRGFEPQAVNGGNGLTNLHERMRTLNGVCAVHSAPDKGTKVSLSWPLTESNGTCEN